MKWIIGGAVAYGVLVYLNEHSYESAAAACSAQTFPNAPAVNGVSMPQMGAGPWCAQYNTWQSQWGWMQPFIPQISLYL